MPCCSEGGAKVAGPSAMVCGASVGATLGEAASEEQHREKIAPKLVPFSSCVARPVGRKELESTPAAREAMRREWNKLIEKTRMELGFRQAQG